MILLPTNIAEANAKLRAFLRAKESPFNHLEIPELTSNQAKELMRRIDNIPLFAHAYAFHLNFRIGGFTPDDILQFTHDNHLSGVKIHISDGEDHSLQSMSENARGAFGEKAKQLGLELHLEASSTDTETLRQLVDIALQTQSTSVRFYPRIAGVLSKVKAQAIAELQCLHTLDPTHKLRFTLEQHEDLKSSEIIEIIESINHPRLTALFDFGNSVNAWETPEASLVGMGEYLTEVHAKDIKVINDKGGWAHRACRTGEGHLNYPKLLFHLMMLGTEKPQVTAIALEEEVDYYAPAFRFPNEDDDPYIPYRALSETELPPEHQKESRLLQEKQDAQRQIDFVRDVLKQMRILLQDIANANH